MTKKQNQPSAEDYQQRIGELTDALQRERADVINIRRRHEEQLANLKNTIKVHIIEDLLPVVDNFERSLKHVPKALQGDDFVKGVTGVVKQFEKTLADLGVTKIKTVGEAFNPELHEAVGIEDSEGTKEIVAEEIQPGYQVNGMVIRPAMVKVKRS